MYGIGDGQIDLVGGRMSAEEASNVLLDQGFSTHSQLESIKKSKSIIPDSDKLNNDEDEDDSVSSSDFDYLLKMPLVSLTKEKMESLNQEATKMDENLKEIRSKKPEDLWMADLEKLAKYLQ